jgi:8-oxo-dGTP diphosphatase
MPITAADGGQDLATQRLNLRPVTASDIPLIVDLAGDAEVAEQTTSIPHPLTGPQVEDWLAGHSTDNECTFAVTRKDDGQFIGVVGLTQSDGDQAEIGYWIGRTFWGNGFATEAVRRVLRHGFGPLGMKQIEASIFPENAASARVLDKTGFTRAGLSAVPAPARGGDREAIVYTVDRVGFARAALSAAVGRQ